MWNMSSVKCNAIFLGKGAIDGQLSSSLLVALIRDHKPKSRKDELEDCRCELLCSEAGLCVTSFKRDEGFESDTESTRSGDSSDYTDEKFCEVAPVKVVADHVFKLGVDVDDSSSANSSGSEDTEDGEGSKKKGVSSGLVKDMYMLQDIVICHREPSHPRVVVWVIRTPRDGSLQTFMFECANEDGAKDLCRLFHEVSRKLKLDKYKQTRHKGDVRFRVGKRVSDKPPPSPTVSVTSVKDVNPNDSVRSRSSDLVDSARPKPWNLVQHTDSNGITHIEIESSDPSSLLSVGSEQDTSSIISLTAPNSGEVFKSGGDKGKTKLMWEKEVVFSGDSEKRKELPNRQRQPALLLRTPPDGEPSASESQKPAPYREHGDGGGKIHRTQTYRSSERRPSTPPSHRYSHRKGPAPLPPPRRHPTNPNLLLVPTKSGQEPQHSPYPKESHVICGKFLRVNVAASPTHHGALVSRFMDFSDLNNNSSMVGAAPMYAVWRQPAEMHHTSRSREHNINPELRRRSRSKSPPRKPMACRYIDAAVTSPKLIGLSQKFKEFSDAVMQKKSKSNGNVPEPLRSLRGDPSSNRVPIIDVKTDAPNLKPVIKKGRRNNEATPENKRVTFNAYATVQMMD